MPWWALVAMVAAVAGVAYFKRNPAGIKYVLPAETATYAALGDFASAANGIQGAMEWFDPSLTPSKPAPASTPPSVSVSPAVPVVASPPVTTGTV